MAGDGQAFSENIHKHDKFVFTCPQCQKQQELPTSVIGKNGKCPACQSVVLVNRTAQPPAIQAPAPIPRAVQAPAPVPRAVQVPARVPRAVQVPARVPRAVQVPARVPTSTGKDEIDFTCPECRFQMTLPSEVEGRQGRCPGCQKMVEVRRDGSAPPATVLPKPTSDAIPQTITFICPQCHHGMELRAEAEGRQGQCPACAQVVTIVATPTSPSPQTPALPAVPVAQWSSPGTGGASVQVETIPLVAEPPAGGFAPQIVSQQVPVESRSTRVIGRDDQKLVSIRNEVYLELVDYQPMKLGAVRRRWFFMGFLGSHRTYLGHNFRAMLMALTSGGFLIWWIIDGFRLKQMTDRWNKDQLKRQKTGKPSRDSDGLILVDPVELQEPPPWKDKPLPILEQMFMFIFTLPIQIVQFPARLLMQKSDRVRELSGFQKVMKFLSMDFVGFYEVFSVGLAMGLISYLFALINLPEIGLMLTIVSITLVFPSAAISRHKTTLGRAALRWDYLICSYYHQRRPMVLWISYWANYFGVFLRPFGWRRAETKLYLALASQAALFSVLTLPLDIIKQLLLSNSAETLLAALWQSTILGLLVSVMATPVYLPPLVGSLAQYKLSGETGKLKFAGIMGCLCALIGTALGFTGIGM